MALSLNYLYTYQPIFVCSLAVWRWASEGSSLQWVDRVSGRESVCIPHVNHLSSWSPFSFCSPPPLQQHRLSPVSVPECVSLGSGNTDLGGLNNIRTVCSSPSLYSASLPLGAGFAWSLTASLLRLDSEGQGFFLMIPQQSGSHKRLWV